MCFMTELSPDEATKTLEQVRRPSMSKHAGYTGQRSVGMSWSSREAAMQRESFPAPLHRHQLRTPVVIDVMRGLPATWPPFALSLRVHRAAADRLSL